MKSTALLSRKVVFVVGLISESHMRGKCITCLVQVKREMMKSRHVNCSSESRATGCIHVSCLKIMRWREEQCTLIHASMPVGSNISLDTDLCIRWPIWLKLSGTDVWEFDFESAVSLSLRCALLPPTGRLEIHPLLDLAKFHAEAG